MASVASQLIQEVTAHAQSDSLEDAPQICADGTYFPNNLRKTRCPNRSMGSVLVSLLHSVAPGKYMNNDIINNVTVISHFADFNINL